MTKWQNKKLRDGKGERDEENTELLVHYETNNKIE